MSISLSIRIDDSKYAVNTENQNHIIMEFSPLIKYLAQKTAAHINYMVETDELVNCGVLGLIDAIEKYDGSRENRFKTYAEFRIKGAMLDYIRDMDWVPRSVRDRAKVLQGAFNTLEEKLGRTPDEKEIAGFLNIPVKEYHCLLNSAQGATFLSFDDVFTFATHEKKAYLSVVEDSNFANPVNEAHKSCLKKMVAKAISELEQREQMIITLYYYEEMNLREIGKTMKLSESRVSQIHTQAIMALKAKLNLMKTEIDC
jgi:RNA polymerase sigma factor FliA